MEHQSTYRTAPPSRQEPSQVAQMTGPRQDHLATLTANLNQTAPVQLKNGRAPASLSQQVVQLARIKNPFLKMVSPAGLNRPATLSHNTDYIWCNPKSQERVKVHCIGCSNPREMPVTTQDGENLVVSGEDLFIPDPMALDRQHDDDEPEQIEEEERSPPLELEEVMEMLHGSSEDTPLASSDLDSIEQWLKENLSSLKRDVSKKISALIKKAQLDLTAYNDEEDPIIKRPRKNRPKKDISPTFANDSGSELSSEDYDPDQRLTRTPAIMGAVSGRSHVYGTLDSAEFRYLVTGLPYADTYLALFKQGSLVPRSINNRANVNGHRKRTRDVQAKIAGALLKRDALFKKIDALRLELENKELTREERKNKRADITAANEQLQDLLMTHIRPHVEALLFGSSGNAGPTEEDWEANENNRKQRASLKEGLKKEEVPSASGELMGTRAPPGLHSGKYSHTHAEQSLINTRTWSGLIQRLITTIEANRDKPEEIAAQSFTTLQLAINRSTCVGCARELTLELIHFWSSVAEILNYKNWRQAKYIFEDYVHFLIDFPAIYESKGEKDNEYKNLGRIIAGLRDAGWQVRVTTGVEASEASNEANRQAQELVKGMASVPQFYVPDWNNPVAFLIPPALEAILKTNHAVRINGVLYSPTSDGKSLVRKTEMDVEPLEPKDVSDAQFLRTGLDHQPGKTNPDKQRIEQEPSKLRKTFALSKSEASNPELDHIFPQQGYQIRNVSGSGMNCLIRAIFTAAGINFDEGMVAIARRHLTELGVARNGDMLDLLDVEGQTLIHFLQAQHVIPNGVGITVHFPGNFMQVVPGNPQLHLWFNNAHFQAIVPGQGKQSG